MAGTVIVGVYQTRADAEAARVRLIERGIREERIHIEQQTSDSADDTKHAHDERDVDEPLPEDRGISGFISRMFSGALMDDAEIEKYAQDVQAGRCVIVVQTADERESAAATTTFTGASVRTYSLTNAQTAWRESTAGDPPSIGDYVDHDPARPEGLIEDAEGLSVDADRALRTPRSR